MAGLSSLIHLHFSSVLRWWAERRNNFCFLNGLLEVHYAHHHANTHACEGVFIPPESKCHFSKCPLESTYIQVLCCSLKSSFYITLCMRHWVRSISVAVNTELWRISTTLISITKKGKVMKIWSSSTITSLHQDSRAESIPFRLEFRDMNVSIYYTVYI